MDKEQLENLRKKTYELMKELKTSNAIILGKKLGTDPFHVRICLRKLLEQKQVTRQKEGSSWTYSITNK